MNPDFFGPQSFFLMQNIFKKIPRAKKFSGFLCVSLRARIMKFQQFLNFLKNVLEYQNGSKFAREPNSTYSTILIKNLKSEKLGKSLFSGPNHINFSMLLYFKRNF